MRRAALKVFQEGKQDERFQILFLKDEGERKGLIEGIANEKLDYALIQYLGMVRTGFSKGDFNAFVKKMG